MKQFDTISLETARKIKYILCDIDDTITTGGKLTAEAYAGIWSLYNAGYGVIPITGRPAGWCDMIVRQWPVLAVIGENGAFAYYFEDSELKSFIHPSVAGLDAGERLKSIADRCLKEVPGCRVSKDQFSRIYDMAIDFCEDFPKLDISEAEKIKEIFELCGANAKISSIHVNAWFGDYDKLSMTKLFFGQILKQQSIKESVLFFGDSPNDEPMFEFFPNSCAVANILRFMDRINFKPAYICENESGKGFYESVSYFLEIVKK